MSGSALLNERTGKVCGIVTRSRETRRDAGAWAVPAGPALDQISGLMEAHKAFHAAERTWRVAREGQLRRQKTLLLRSPFSPLPAFEHTPPSFLLQATYGVVPFRGRVNELADAEEWCFGADQLACRLILGPGGTGKTRLAVHLRLHSAYRRARPGIHD